MTGSRRSFPFAAIFLILVTITTILPFIAIVSASLQPAGSIVRGVSWPTHPAFENFLRAWSDAGFATLFQSSAIVAFVVVPVGAIFASWAGFAVGTMTFRGKAFVLALFLLGLTLPYEAIVVPLYYGLRGIGLLDTYWALILPLIGAFMPFGVFWMQAHFMSFPPSLMEAARMDGASNWTAFWRILVPNSWGAITTLALLYFMWSWNQFLLALILIQDPSKRTAPAGLGQFVSQFGKDVPLLSAATILVILPVVVVFLVFQRRIIQGFLAGTVKE
jgi:raffinose/stachyose/melibiose transport system permease protein